MLHQVLCEEAATGDAAVPGLDQRTGQVPDSAVSQDHLRALEKENDFWSPPRSTELEFLQGSIFSNLSRCPISSQLGTTNFGDPIGHVTAPVLYFSKPLYKNKVRKDAGSC